MYNSSQSFSKLSTDRLYTVTPSGLTLSAMGKNKDTSLPTLYTITLLAPTDDGFTGSYEMSLPNNIGSDEQILTTLGNGDTIWTHQTIREDSHRNIWGGSGTIQPTGYDNLVIGVAGGASTISGNQNIGIGNYIYADLTSGNENIAHGYFSGNTLVSGNRNIYIGNVSSASSPSASNEIVLGANTTGRGTGTVLLGNATTSDVYIGSTGTNLVLTSTNLSMTKVRANPTGVSFTLTLPVSGGEINQVLSSGGAGNTYWGDLADTILYNAGPNDYTIWGGGTGVTQPTSVTSIYRNIYIANGSILNGSTECTSNIVLGNDIRVNANIARKNIILGSNITGINDIVQSTIIGLNSRINGTTDSVLIGNNLDSGTETSNIVCIGVNNIVPNNNSIGVGVGCTTSGTGSISIGWNSTSDNNSISIGVGSIATLSRCIAMGWSSTASGTGSIAIGPNCSSIGPASVTIGNTCISGGDICIAIGNGAICFETSAIAIGNSAQSEGINAIALGTSIQSYGLGTIAIGNLTQCNGTGTIAIGIGCSSIGAKSITLGNTCVGTSVNCIAIGTEATAGGSRSVVLGYQSSTTVGSINAVVIGNTSTGIGSGSIIIGSESSTTLGNTIVIGNGIAGTQAYGLYMTHRVAAAGVTASWNADSELVENTSSLRYKQNVLTFERDSEIFKQVRPVCYNPKEGYGNVDDVYIGMIAEELDPLYPEFVCYDEDLRPKSIRYDMFTAVLVHEMQKMMQKIQILSDRVSVLEK